MEEQVTKTHDLVKERYSGAAIEKEEALCCPTGYSKEELDHVPQEVIDVSYGCGNPTGFNTIKNGNIVLDLGAGAGIDCFIVAKKVGSSGKVIGLDMTDSMLEKANKNKSVIVKNLGYDNVEFKKGHLEKMPIADNSVDVVMSNCVINLSHIKQEVFNEMFRVIKDGGCFLVSDIVSDKEVPQHMKDDKELWSGCLSGAVTVDEYQSYMEKSGFFGLKVLKDFHWKKIEDVNFHSVTIKGYKLNRSKECIFIGQTATYKGPLLSVTDDEEHTFKRGVAVSVCSETAKRLSREPYKCDFVITDPTKKKSEGESCDPKSGCC